jgi:hypothetical protein
MYRIAVAEHRFKAVSGEIIIKLENSILNSKVMFRTNDMK